MAINNIAGTFLYIQVKVLQAAAGGLSLLIFKQIYK